MPAPVHPYPLRIWKRAMLGVVALVACVDGYFLFRGYTPGPIDAGSYMMCLFMSAGTPIIVAMGAKGFVDGERDFEPALGFLVALLFPLAGILAWSVSLAGFVAFIDGWVPPVRWLFANPYAFLLASIALGLVLVVVLSFLLVLVAIGLARWRRSQRSPGKRSAPGA